MTPASDWCQRWSEKRHSWRHRSEGGFEARGFDVADISEGLAKAFVEREHYSGTYPASRLRYGLWTCRGELVGVAVLSVPVQRAVLSGPFPGLAPYRESLELGRFVLLDQVPANGETWFLTQAFRLAGRQGVRGVVSFADPVRRTSADGRVICPGHVGTIYQAANALYAGRGDARTILVLPDGRTLNNRALSKVRGLERGHEYVEALLERFGAAPRRGTDPRAWLVKALAQSGTRRIWHPGNHRYLFRIGRPAERRAVTIAMRARPYPKLGEVASVGDLSGSRSLRWRDFGGDVSPLALELAGDP